MIVQAGQESAWEDHGWGRCYRRRYAPGALRRWAWLADPHVSARADAERTGCQPARRLDRAMLEMAAARTQGIVVNGDLAWSAGKLRDYGRFWAILAPRAWEIPLLLTVGNHDHRGNLVASVNPDHSRAPKRLAGVVDHPPFRSVGLDSQISPSTVGGALGSGQLGWLDGLLASGPRLRTLIFLHHPGESSSEGCADFADLERLAARHRCVQAIVTGHDHEFALDRQSGVHHVRQPAVGFPFDGKTRCGWLAANLGETGLTLRAHCGAVPRTYELPWR